MLFGLLRQDLSQVSWLLSCSVQSTVYVRAGESLPPREPVAVSCPTMQAAPTEDQPPKLENSVKTSFAGAYERAC